MPSEARLEKIYIETWGLGDFLRDVQEAVKQGYEVDLVTNDTYPQSFSNLFTATLLKPSKTTLEALNTPDVAEVSTTEENSTESVLEAPEVTIEGKSSKPRKAKA